MNKAVFLDRDGVVNTEVDYLHEPEKVKLEKHVVEAFRIFRRKGYKLVVVTNQAGVAKGVYKEEDIAPVHEKIQELLAAENLSIDAFYYCIHHPDFTGACSCRKPAPGMLLRAAADLDIDVSQSVMVGDRMSDVEAGVNAGCAHSYLIRTGYGRKLASEAPAAAEIVDDLLELAEKLP